MPDILWKGLTPADQALLSKVTMHISSPPQPISGFPGDGDGQVFFQFPPRITSDNKTMNWTEEGQIYAWEPQSSFNGSSARRIQLEATYIITSKGGGWDLKRISDMVRVYKAYFYHTQGEAAGPTNMPLIQLQIYDHAPDFNIFWRAKNFQLTHDGALINDGGKVFPLISKISIDLHLLTKVDLGNGPLHDITALPVPDVPAVGWY